MELIRNVYVRRPKHADLLENFKHFYFLSQTRTKHTQIFSDVHRRAPDVHPLKGTYILVSRFERVSDGRQAYLEFFQHARRASHLHANVRFH